MKDEQKIIVSRVFSSVLENLAFMFVETSEETDIPDGAPPFIAAEMTFCGPCAGRLKLAAPEAICPDIAANVLGLDPDDEFVQTRLGDALKELLNVVCGNVLSALAGEDPIFDLTVPQLTALSQDVWEELLDSEESLVFVVDEYPVVLQCHFDGEL